MKSKVKVLFICIHNSARSQMAEAYLNKLGGEEFQAESAGLEPGILNPLAIEAMQLDGIDISKNPTKDVFELWKKGNLYHYVVTVCDAKNSERCPIFPGVSKKIAWMFDDPSSFAGTPEEKVAATIKVRDEIKKSVQDLINNYHQGNL